MKAPPTGLPKPAAFRTSIWPGTHFVTGDALDTSSTTAAATLVASTSSPTPSVSEADLDVSNTSNTAAPDAEALVHPTTEASVAPTRSEASVAPTRSEASVAPTRSEASVAPTRSEASVAPTRSEASVAPTRSEASVAPTRSEASVAPTRSEASVAPTRSEASVAPTRSEASVAPTRSEASVAPTRSEASVAPTRSEASVAPTCSEASVAPTRSEASVAPITPTPSEASVAQTTSEASVAPTTSEAFVTPSAGITISALSEGSAAPPREASAAFSTKARIASTTMAITTSRSDATTAHNLKPPATSSLEPTSRSSTKRSQVRKPSSRNQRAGYVATPASTTEAFRTPAIDSTRAPAAEDSNSATSRSATARADYSGTPYWRPSSPPYQLDRSQSYRKYYDETPNSLTTVFSSLLDESGSESSTPPPPPPLAEIPPGPSTSKAVTNAGTSGYPQRTSKNTARTDTFRASRSRSEVPPGGLSGVLFTDAVHRMMKHLALTQMHVGTAWLTLLQIFTENGGNGSSRFHDVHKLTIIRAYAIVRPERQPDIWFSLRDARSRRALEYFVRLSTQYAWWTCRFIDVLQTPTPSAATAVSRILKRLRPSLHGIAFPQSPDFWSTQAKEVRRMFTWLPINQPARQYVRGIQGYADHLIEPDYWTQSRLVRMNTSGCDSYGCPGSRNGLTTFSFYRDFTRTDAPQTAQFRHPVETTDDDYVLQANIPWPSIFFFYWPDFGTHITILDVRLFAACHPVAPQGFLRDLMRRVRDWPNLRQLQIDVRYSAEALPSRTSLLSDQATDFAAETSTRCRDLRTALTEQPPPLQSEVSVTTEYDCWHASPSDLHQAVLAVCQIMEGPQQRVALEQRSDTSYVISTTWNGQNYRLTLRVFLRTITIGRSLPAPAVDTEAKRVAALRARLQKILESDKRNA